MKYTSIHLWADSIGKGVAFDEGRNRYVILRERCAASLEAALGVPVVNHSRMGATVTEGYAEFLEHAAAPEAIAVIAYGGNDCDMPWQQIAENPDTEHIARTPLPKFKETLQSFVETARARGMTPLLVTPPPLEANRYFDWVTKGLRSDAVLRFLGDVAHIYRWQERYSIAVRQVAQTLGCALFDLRDAFLADMHYPHLFSLDGIHPNADGHALITQAAVALWGAR